MHLSACIEWLFAEEQDFAARIPLAAADGIRAIEFWEWREKDLKAIENALGDVGVEVTCFCCDPPGQLIDARTHAAFLEGLGESIAVAQRLNCSRLIVVAGDTEAAQTGGQEDGSVAQEARWEALLGGLSRAAQLAEREQVQLLLEPLNTTLDHPGHFLSATDRALDLIETIDSPNVRLLLDVYHSQMMAEAEPAVLLRGRERLLGHVHVADMPGRAEPGTGEIDWAAIVESLRLVGYDGAVGLEYMPQTTTAASLGHTRHALGLPR